jgi:serine/threonine protein kinase
MIGSKLLHYEITAKLGEGGMGEVYKATDSKLGREVAIKVLPAAFVEDPERLARFEREARVLAALEHPNIAGIYGLEEADGKQLLVMQLASGEDLSVRLGRGPMAIDEVLPIALQIAQALEAAHDKGIVHRDLKPANVMLAHDGSVKVLDFGLAEAWEDGGPGSDPNLTASPTLTAQMTQAGVILGTAGYMSPEQARGQEADRRSDIWSFGVVLHEMLTGKRLFQADTVSDTLARVLMAEPEWDEVDASLPGPIAALLRRCLERDTARRLQAIGEARIAIEDHMANPEAVPAAPPSPAESETRPAASKWMRASPWVIIGVAVGWLLALSLSGPKEEAPSEVLRFAIQRAKSDVLITEDVNGVDISRDGRQIAFIAEGPEAALPMIYLKRLLHRSRASQSQSLGGQLDLPGRCAGPSGRRLERRRLHLLRASQHRTGRPDP